MLIEIKAGAKTPKDTNLMECVMVVVLDEKMSVSHSSMYYVDTYVELSPVIEKLKKDYKGQKITVSRFKKESNGGWEEVEISEAQKDTMIIIRDLLFSKEAKEADSIFINDNGDQIHYQEKEGRTKEILLNLAGKALIPTSQTKEVKSDYLADYIIYDTSIGIIVTLIKDKKGDQ